MAVNRVFYIAILQLIFENIYKKLYIFLWKTKNPFNLVREIWHNVNNL